MNFQKSQKFLYFLTKFGTAFVFVLNDIFMQNYVYNTKNVLKGASLAPEDTPPPLLSHIGQTKSLSFWKFFKAKLFESDLCWMGKMPIKKNKSIGQISKEWRAKVKFRELWKNSNLNIKTLKFLGHKTWWMT